MKKLIKNIIYKLNYRLKKIIILESNPTLSDNTYYVYKELINRNINMDYKIFWLISDDSKKYKFVTLKNVFFINRKPHNFLQKLKLYYVKIFATYIIDCNLYVNKINKNQFRIHLTHGMALKLAKEYTKVMGTTDFLTITSDYFTEIFCKIYCITNKQILITGYPRNDAIFSENKYILFPTIKRNKTILWMPTYRNHKSSFSHEKTTNIYFPYGMPCVSNEKELKSLNDLLHSNNVLLILKLHPAEDVSKIKSLCLSNIIILSNDYLFDNHKTIYDYLNNVDALITDYSSIYYDFLLTKKMIGLAIPDLIEYQKHVDLYVKDYKNDIIGNYIENFNDLIQFVNDVYNSIDLNYNTRIESIYRFHKYFDGNSAKRVVDVIENNMRGND